MKSSDILESMLQLADRIMVAIADRLYAKLASQYEFETLVAEELRK